MNWKTLNSLEQLEDIIALSDNKPVLILKHSTRCSISEVVKKRLERSWPEDCVIEPFYLDLLTYRPVSNAITELFLVEHASPQVLLIKNGDCVYDESHNAIRVDDLLEAAAL
jgi:bacillithiol system protein YtxJ